MMVAPAAAGGANIGSGTDNNDDGEEEGSSGSMMLVVILGMAVLMIAGTWVAVAKMFSDRAASNLDMQTMIENSIKNTMIENTMNTLDNKTQVMSDATIDFTPVRF